MDTNQAFIDTTTQKEIINQLSEKLKTCYVDPAVAEQICARLQGYLHDGEYADLTEGNLFSLALTLHLQEVNHDEHLWVKWHAEALPEDDGQLRLNRAWQEDRKREASLGNFGFNKIETLTGNVGYLNIHYFHRPAWGGDTAVSCMNFLTQSSALIIDLRKCTGGYPGMVALICTYLFGEEPIHLVSIYWRDEDITQQYWTLPYVPGKHYPDKPVYVLTSKETFSGGEMFANILQTRKRATLIGEKTDGGANAGASYRIHPHVEAFIPIGRTIDPLTGSNWEGCGITPDISITQVQSFNTAYQLALQSILADLNEATSEPLRKQAEDAQIALKGLQNS
jgi:C-terminal processing protease CtpA/Prc